MHLLTESEFHERANELISRMTLEEKVGQLAYVDVRMQNRDADIKAGRIGTLVCSTDPREVNRFQKMAVEESRLGIPMFFGNDVVHGYRTIFPIPLAEACSWDMDLIGRTASLAAREAAAAGTQWIYAPMVDIARDPRWGRIAEGAGEDTYLGCATAAARVRGFQENADIPAPRPFACAKHYVAYGAAEGGRDYDSVDMSDNTLRDIYLPPFQSAVAAGVATIMTSFNDYNGMPVTANKYLIKKMLRDELGFKGIVITDYYAIRELMAHRVAASEEEACFLAFSAGIDMDMNSDIYSKYLPGLVRSGKIAVEEIDDSVRRVLELKFRIGLFKNAFVDLTAFDKTMLSEEHMACAREAASESMVLLKNKNRLLPIGNGIRSLAVIGPMADDRLEQLGCWACDGLTEDVVTVLQGIREKSGTMIAIHYEKGCDIENGSHDGIERAVLTAKACDAVILVVGESAGMSGEFHSRSSLGLPGMQKDLVQAVIQTGIPAIVVLLNGRPLALPWLEKNAGAILEAWHPGTQGGRSVADVLFGDFNPSGKLSVSIPQTVGQIPIHYNHRSSGKPAFEGSLEMKAPVTNYIDIGHKPLYPFGYGLSYTEFKFGNLEISDKKTSMGLAISVSVDIENCGSLDGIEVAQLYVQDVTASSTRPVKELKGFHRIFLKAGERKKIIFNIDTMQLGFHGRDMKYRVEPGFFRIFVGSDSRADLEDGFELIEQGRIVI